MEFVPVYSTENSRVVVYRYGTFVPVYPDENSWGGASGITSQSFIKEMN